MQLVNAREKIEDAKQALLLLLSLHKSYKSSVQKILVGRPTLGLNNMTSI